MKTGALELTMVTQHLVRFTKVGEIVQSDWDSAQTWWTDDSSEEFGPDFFNVPLTTLAVRAIWLQQNWAAEGYGVIVEPEVSNAVAKLREQEKDFVKLMRIIEKPASVDLSSIALKRQLTNEQIANLAALLRMKNGANFSVPGAGKTTTTLVLWGLLREMGIVDSILVVCPKSAFEAWEEEPEEVFQHAPQIEVFGSSAISSGTSIVVVNYEALEKPARLRRLVAWASNRKCMLVIDEAHRVKSGPRSVRWRACSRLSAVAVRTELLTGTPMPQSYEDLINLYMLSWRTLTRKVLSESNLVGLTRGGVFVRTTKQELGLPRPLIKRHLIESGPIQRAIYDALRQTYAGTFAMNSRDSDLLAARGRAVMSLLGAATNPGLLMKTFSEDSYLGLRWPPKEVQENAELMSLISNYVSVELPPKYDWVRRYVAKAANEGRKVLVWSTFVGNLLAMKALLEPHNPALVFGGVSQIDRRSEIERFRNSKDCHVLLSNPQTLGEGISLHHTCHDAIYVDRSYNAGMYLQSLDRIHRLGLSPEQETRIQVLVCKNTVDQRVDARLETKVARLGLALDDPGLTLVSLPDDSSELEMSEFLGVDEFDENDLYQHLIQDGR